MNSKLFFKILIMGLFLTACRKTESESKILTVMTHDSFSVSEEMISTFEETYSIEVKFFEAGDTGTAVNKAILSKNAPLADVFYGIDNTFISRALEEEIFEVYKSPVLTDIPNQFEIGSRISGASS